MDSRRIIVAGGGAAGFFAAIACAEAQPKSEVVVLEKSPSFLSKVRISGGGRCNVTHACFDAQELSQRYPRGAGALIAPLHRFGPAETVAWFEQRGVALKTESDGRVFPRTDSSGTIIDCLLRAADAARIQLEANRGVAGATLRPGGGFRLRLLDGTLLDCDRLLLATGGCRTPAAGDLTVSLGHTLEAPVPSLFTFRVAAPWLHQLAGLAVEQVEVAIPEARLRERGPLLLTHTGLSGPVILCLSAWGARALHGLGYRFSLQVNWLPSLSVERISDELRLRQSRYPARRVSSVPLSPLPSRLWAQLLAAAGVAEETRWAGLSRTAQHHLVQQLVRTILPVSGKSLNRDEFVTCGGARLSEVDFTTMESRITPGLHFAGELLDIDGLTGGFNFQAAWTTGWIAGQAMAVS